MFQALELSLEAIQSLREPARLVERRDPRLGSQLRAAASSFALNLAEGNRRRGKDRLHHFRIAAGSADEALAALRVAQAWGYVETHDIAESLELLDRLLAMAWKLTRG
jgi:four helix bundle protein